MSKNLANTRRKKNKNYDSSSLQERGILHSTASMKMIGLKKNNAQFPRDRLASKSIEDLNSFEGEIFGNPESSSIRR